jgi:hypothetical protein
MTHPIKGRVLYVIACGAGPAGEVGRLVELAQDRGWTVQVIATPSALAFIDMSKLETQTGRPVRSEYRGPGEPRSPQADAIIVAQPRTTQSTNGPTASATPTPSAFSPKRQAWVTKLDPWSLQRVSRFPDSCLRVTRITPTMSGG